MPNETKLPNFNEFSHWLASRLDTAALGPERYEELQGAARAARDEFIEASHRADQSFEVLQLLAAADGDAALPPEIMTPKGYRITMAYDEGDASKSASIGVLVTCPPELERISEGKTVYLWNDGERFELGQFDAEGKALGTLPAGLEITASDFALGKVRLETQDTQ